MAMSAYAVVSDGGLGNAGGAFTVVACVPGEGSAWPGRLRGHKHARAACLCEEA